MFSDVGALSGTSGRFSVLVDRYEIRPGFAIVRQSGIGVGCGKEGSGAIAGYPRGMLKLGAW